MFLCSPTAPAWQVFEELVSTLLLYFFLTPVQNSSLVCEDSQEISDILCAGLVFFGYAKKKDGKDHWPNIRNDQI